MDETTSPRALQEGSTNRNRTTLPDARLQVLENEDVLEVIFSYFEPESIFDDLSDTLEQSTRTALLFACLTCTSFVTPASNLLWRKMASVMPIFKILPTFVKVNDIYTFSGALEPAHIQRFEMYARKVRFLKIRALPDPIAGHCIHRLSSIPNFKLFPALKVLYMPEMDCRTRTLDNFNVLFLVHGHLLTTITIGSINLSNESLVSSLLFSLSQKAPLVQDIYLTGCLSLETLNLLNDFRQLQSICLTFFATTQRIPALRLLQCFSNLPDLTYLNLVLHDTILDTTNSPTRERVNGFQSLQSLFLSAIPGEMVKILGSIDGARHLINIELTANSTSDIQLPISLQACIDESCRIALNLKYFWLSVRTGWGLMATSSLAPGLASGSLSPLSRCQQLVQFELADVALPITDEQIYKLCGNDAWKNLTSLLLPPVGNGQAPPLSILHTLAENCPNLVSLKIPVDLKLDTPASLRGIRRQPRGSHPLRELTIVKKSSTLSNQSDPSNTPKMGIAVARFLEHHFPHLEEAELKLQANASGDHQWWSAVVDNIAEFRSVRVEMEKEFIERMNIGAN